jgi:hypothetical protein
MENTNTTQTQETQAQVQTEERHSRHSPDAVEFVRIWNESSSRQDALTRFKTAGYDMTYTAMVAREKSYRGKGVQLKQIDPAPRGKRLDVNAINQAIAARAVKNEKKEGEEKPAVENAAA